MSVDYCSCCIVGPQIRNGYAIGRDLQPRWLAQVHAWIGSEQLDLSTVILAQHCPDSTVYSGVDIISFLLKTTSRSIDFGKS